MPGDGRRGAYLFFYQAGVDTAYARDAVGLQHLAFTVRTRSEVRRVHDAVVADGSPVLHAPQSVPGVPRRRTSPPSGSVRTGSCLKRSATTIGTEARGRDHSTRAMKAWTVSGEVGRSDGWNRMVNSRRQSRHVGQVSGRACGIGQLRRLAPHPGQDRRVCQREVGVNRYYDPSTDQFISVDPKLAETGQPYAFTADDPLNSSDIGTNAVFTG